jgi:hypothetical protein
MQDGGDAVPQRNTNMAVIINGELKKAAAAAAAAAAPPISAWKVDARISTTRKKIFDAEQIARVVEGGRENIAEKIGGLRAELSSLESQWMPRWEANEPERLVKIEALRKGVAVLEQDDDGLRERHDAAVLRARRQRVALMDLLTGEDPLAMQRRDLVIARAGSAAWRHALEESHGTTRRRPPRTGGGAQRVPAGLG